MKFFKKFFSNFKNSNSKTNKNQDNFELIRNLNITSIENNDKTFEEKFVNYDSFEITQDNINYSINVLFTKDLDLKQKEKIFKFVKEEFNKNVTPPLIGLNIRLMYDLCTGYKNISDRKTLKIFIGNTEI